MENWDDLRFVLALRRFASMTRAAKALNANPATVSRRIQRVSERIGAPVFVKDEHGWRPTAEGLRLARIAELLDEDLSKFDTDLPNRSEEVSGRVRVSGIGFVNQYFLAPRLAAFHQLFPRLELHLLASDERASLAYGEADLAIRLKRPSDGRLVGRRIARQPVAVFEDPSVREASAPGKSLGEAGLEAELEAVKAANDRLAAPVRWVGLPEPLDWIEEMRMGRELFGCAPQIRCDSFGAVAEAVSAVGGYCILPTCLAGRFPALRRVPAHPATLSREVWTVFHETRRSDPRIACVLRWLDSVFSSAGQCLCGRCPALGEEGKGAAPQKCNADLA